MKADAGTGSAVGEAATGEAATGEAAAKPAVGPAVEPLVGVVLILVVDAASRALSLISTSLRSTSGVWCVVCGVWCVVCGAWCVVRGVWCVVCGVWCVMEMAKYRKTLKLTLQFN